MPSLYEPTPEEEAYAVYVFEKLFGSFPFDGLIHVEQSLGLRVLENSGVDGIILRTIWSVADPDNLRCITYMSQFHVILRLIALAQDGLLEKEINRAFTQERNNTTPVVLFQRTLWMSSAYRDCPLAQFQGVPKPSKKFLQEFSSRLKGIPTQQQSPVPVPAPAPPTPSVSSTLSPAPVPAPLPPRTPVPAPIPAAAKSKFPPESVASIAPACKSKAPASGTNNKKSYNSGHAVSSDPITKEVRAKTTSPTGIESAFRQVETLGVDSPNPRVKDLKELDPDNFELLQEQTALQRAILESNKAAKASKKQQKPVVAKKPSPKFQTQQPENDDEDFSEDAALQKAIYESTHAASPPRKEMNVAMAPKKHHNWLRMSSLDDSISEIANNKADDDSDDEYKKKKTKKGDAAYAEYVASLDPSPPQIPPPPIQGKSDQSQDLDASDRKPAAKPPANTAVPPTVKRAASTEKEKKANTNPQKPVRKSADNRVDEYPQVVQELVMNGFALDKAIQGYKMLGTDNFDDMVLFLTSSMTVKDMVLNGFNIHKVVEAVEIIGDNEDDLLAYLMANAT